MKSKLMLIFILGILLLPTIYANPIADKISQQDFKEFLDKINPLSQERNLGFMVIEAILLIALVIYILQKIRKRKNPLDFAVPKSNEFGKIVKHLFILVGIIAVLWGIFYAYQNIKIPTPSSALIQDPLFRDIILIASIALIAIILFKTLNIRGEIRFGKKPSPSGYFGDKRVSKLQNRLNREILKNELKKEKGKKHHRVRKLSDIIKEG